MHIVDTTLFFAPASGGVKRYLLAKHRFFARLKGVRHSIVVPGKGDEQTADGIVHVASPRLPGAGGYRCPISISRWTGILRSLDPSLIEAGDPYHVAWAALRAARDCDAPAVAFLHSDLPRIASLHGGRAAAGIARWYTRNLYRRFDLVTTAGDKLAAELRAQGIRRVAVQPLGVDTDIFNPRRRDAAVRRELGLDDDVRLLVYAGRVSAEKRVDRLLEMMTLLGEPYHLLIVGGRGLQTLPRVTVYPYEPDNRRLARLFASADALVHAGRYETFGLVFLEAMACGRPVVGVRAGGAAQIVTPAVGRLAADDSAASLAAAVNDLFAHDPAAIGRLARRMVEQRYAWEPLFKRQLERYTRLVRGRAAHDAAAAQASA